MACCFGEFVLDAERWELRCHGTPVALEPRAMHVLVELIERRDRVVTKHELLDAVWGDRFVGESALTTQVKEIRRALGDDGRSQTVIRTVHGRGYQFVAEVTSAPTVDQQRVDRTTDAPIVAVLPFETLPADGDRPHVADGLTAEVIAALTKHRWFRVLSRAVSGGFVARPDPATALRDELGVQYVVDGSVHVDVDRLRVTVALTDTRTGTCRWAERYDRRFADLFDVLDEITGVLVAALEPAMGGVERERARNRPRADLRAWDLHHLGVAHLFRFTGSDNREAQRLLDRARRLDPEFGEPHAWWAYSVVLGMTYWDTDPDAGLLDAALHATGVAVSIDDQDAVAHMIRGRVRLARREYDAALLENERAIELNPTFAAAYCGLGDSLCYEGRYDEALDRFERAVALGTHDPQRWAFLSYGALALLFSGRYDDAVAWSEQAAALPNCQYWATAHRAVALAYLGRRDECARAVTELRTTRPDFTVALARRKLFYLKRPEQHERYVAGLAAAGVPDV